MNLKRIKTIWLNFILRVSAIINKSKGTIIDGGILKTLSIAFVIILLETFLLIVALPAYIFISPEKFSKTKKEVQKYRLRRIVSIAAVCTFILIFLITTIFSSGIFLTGPVSEISAMSIGWSFDNPKEYMYDSSKIQIVDGIALLKPDEKKQDKASEDSSGDNSEKIEVRGLSEESEESLSGTEGESESPEEPEEEPAEEPKEESPEEPEEEPAEEPEEELPEEPEEEPAEEPEEELPEEPEEEPAEEPEEEPAEKIGSDSESLTEEKEKICRATIQPVESLVIPDIAGWDGFIEIASKNSGEIYYQLSDDNGRTWYYWNNKWIKAGGDDYNTAKKINENIKDFPADTGQIMFKAFFINDCKSEMQLLDITVAFSQEAKKEEVKKVAAGKVAEWSLNENSGSKAKDNTGNNNGSITGANWTGGVSGSALDFDGKGGHIEIPNSSTLDVSGEQITLTLWFKLTEEKDEGSFIFKNTQYLLRVNNQGRVSFALYNPSWSEVSMSWDSRITDNNWHHIAGIYNGKEIKIYLDGQEIASKPSSGNIQSRSSNVWIGSQTGSLNQFDGILDEVQIYDRALSNSEIKQLYDKNRPAEGNQAPAAHAGGPYSIEENSTVELDGTGSSDPDGSIDSYYWKIIEGPGSLTQQDISTVIYKAPEKLEAAIEVKVELTIVDDNGVSDIDTAVITVSPVYRSEEEKEEVKEGGLVSQWKLDENSGTAAGDSVDNNDGTIKGASWIAGISGSGLYFDGIDDHIKISNTPILNPTEKISFEAWVKTEEHKTAAIVQKGDWDGHGIGQDKWRGWKAGVYIDGGKKYSIDWGQGRPVLDEWYHLAMTYDGIYLKLYVNGSEVKSMLLSGSLKINSRSFSIGSDSGAQKFFQGKIDEVSFYNKALSSEEIKRHYANNRPGEEEEEEEKEEVKEGGLVSQWKLNEDSGNTAGDSVGSNNGTIHNAAWTSGADGNALEFRGTERPCDYIEIPDAEEFRSTGKFSVSVWVKAADTNNFRYIIDKWWYSGSDDRSWSLNFKSGNLVWRGSDNGRDSGEKSVSYPYSAHLNKWTHIAGVYNGEELQLYINGKLAGTRALSSIMPTKKPVFVGAGNCGDGWPFKGIIDEISYYDKALTSSEVQGIYAHTDPEEEEKEEEEDEVKEGVLVSQWKLNEDSGNTAGDSVGNNNGTIHNAVWTAGKENSALVFNGAGSYITIDNSADLNPRRAITVSAWVKWNIDPATGNAWAQIVSKNGDYQYQLQHNHGNTAFEFAIKTSSGRKYIIGNLKVLPDVWNFIAGTYDGSTIKLFVNGGLDASASWSGDLITSTGALDIGRRSVRNDRYFNGIIDEVSVWSRALNAAEINALYLEGKNNRPEIVINSAVQQGDGGYVNIDYTLNDSESHFIDLSNYEYSLTGDFAGEESSMTIAALDSGHDGVSGLSSSAAGIKHTFVWDAAADLADMNDLSVYIRLRPDDGIEPGEFSVSNAFIVGADKPVISNVSAVQKIGTNNVEISYDLSGGNNDGLNIELEISDDGGSTWMVSTASAAGDIGSGISSETGKRITWDAATDFGDKDETDIQARLRAADVGQNVSDYAYSEDFALDTRDPLGLNDFSGVSADTSSIVWSWTPVSVETNFKYYKIWYGQNLEDVQNKKGTAAVWDISDDSDLSVMGTASTLINGLSEGTAYYAIIWAVDSFGNEATIAETQFITDIIESDSEITPPFKPVLDQPQTPTANAEIRVSGITEPDSYIDLYIDGEKIEPQFTVARSNGEFTGTIILEEGEYELYVIAHDSYGNSSESSNIVSGMIDFKLGEERKEEIIEKEPGTEGTPIEVKVIEAEETTIIEDVSRAEESQILQIPQIIEVKGIDAGNNIVFIGKGIPNSEIVIFIHSEQAIVYRTQVNENGDWNLSHSQNDVELAEGDHEVYAQTLDAKSHIKSRISTIKKFQVKVNRIAIFLSYFDLLTTLLTLFIVLIGIIVFYIWRSKRVKVNKKN